MSEDVVYGVEPDLGVEEFIDVLRRSGLDARRPVGDRPRIARMLANSNLIVTARAGSRLVGVSRAVSDVGYCCYLSDLAVDRADQKRGIGRRLIAETRARAGGPDTMLLLLAAPGVEGYYRHIGMENLTTAFLIPRAVP